MATYEQKRALREQGMTYQQIADKLGISKQAVAQTLAKTDTARARQIKPSMCIYPGLRNWMNANKVSMAELVRRCGYVPYSGNRSNFRDYLNGRHDLRKPTIDKILEITGMTYEQAFGEEDV